MEIKNVVLAGGGVLGSQIAYITSYHNFDVTIWGRSEDSLARTKKRLEFIRDLMIKDLEETRQLLGSEFGKYKYPKGLIDDYDNLDSQKIDTIIERVKKSLERINLEVDMDKAFGDADLVIEAMTENVEEKTEFYKTLAPHLPEKTILATNSSTLLPSQFAEYTGRPEKYLALHFANNIWKLNIGEVMGHPGTDKKYYDMVAKFAGDIGMIPILLEKEQSGYVINSLLVPFLNSALALWGAGVADPETIDKTWKIGTSAPRGPFEMIDVIGLKTTYQVSSSKLESKDEGSVFNKVVKMLKEKIDRGEEGVATGKGFYDYTNK